jgi:hypothetical protein
MSYFYSHIIIIEQNSGPWLISTNVNLEQEELLRVELNLKQLSK